MEVGIHRMSSQRCQGQRPWSEFCLLSGLRIRTQKLSPSCRSVVQEGISHMTKDCGHGRVGLSLQTVATMHPQSPPGSSLAGMPCLALAPACTLSSVPLLMTSTRSCPNWERLSLSTREKGMNSVGKRTPSAAGLCKPSGSVPSQTGCNVFMPNTPEPGVPGVMTSARCRPELWA